MIIQEFRLENTEGNHNKYYEVQVDRLTSDSYNVLFSYGPIGRVQGSGVKNKRILSGEQALSMAEKLVNSKLAKGYSIVQNVQAVTPSRTNNARPSNQTVSSRKASIRPQLLLQVDDVEKYISDPNYCAQEKFDGVRRIYKYEKGEVSGINRKGAYSPGVPEIIEDIKRTCVFEDRVAFDGEELDGKLYAFDMVAPTSASYKLRYQRLKSFASDRVIVIPTAFTEAEKRGLFRRLKKSGREGIVFKDVNASYTRGARNESMVKFKFYEEASCIVEALNDKSSIKICLLNDKGERVSVGNCTIPNGKEKPKKGDIVEIKYLYAYKGGSLYQPAYKGVRSDVSEDECLMGQLKYKSEDHTPVIIPKKKRRIVWSL